MEWRKGMPACCIEMAWCAGVVVVVNKTSFAVSP